MNTMKRGLIVGLTVVAALLMVAGRARVPLHLASRAPK